MCFLSLYIRYDWIDIMGYSNHELSTINMFSTPPKIVILHPYLPIAATSPQQAISSVLKVAFVKRFDCIYFEKGCRKNCARDNPERYHGI